MSALAFASVSSSRTTPASGRLWAEMTSPSEQGFEERLPFTYGPSSQPQNNVIASSNETPAALLQQLGGHGDNVVVIGGVFGANVNTSLGKAVNIWQEASDGWALLAMGLYYAASGSTASFGTGVTTSQGTFGGMASFGTGATTFHAALACTASAETGVTISHAASGGWHTPLYQTLAGEVVVSASTTMQMLSTPMDALVAELEELRELPEDWDGEGAEAPIPDAINEAVCFARCAGDYLARRLDPTPDVDGSILLEIDDGSGSFRFRGDNTIIYAIRGAMPGIVRFDGTMPEKISEVLQTAL